ncbi:MAG: toxin-antitoxin system YwqK family antitoxin [Putridiphycobacter sp.]
MLKSILTLLFTNLLVYNFAQTKSIENIQKEIDIIVPSEVVSISKNAIQFTTVFEYDLMPNSGDSVFVYYQDLAIDDKMYLKEKVLTFPFVFSKSLASEISLVKNFELKGTTEAFSEKIKKGEFVSIHWKKTTEVTHEKHVNADGKTEFELYSIEGLAVAEETSFKDGVTTIRQNILGHYHGREEQFKDGQKIKECYWNLGQLNGTNKTWFSNGQLASETYYINDKKENKATTYYQNGQIKELAFFRNDQLFGAYKSFNAEGKPIDVCEYVTGKKVGQAIKYFENGQPNLKINYKDGVTHGPYERYFENGTLNVKTNFINGKLDGHFIEYYQDGEKKSEGKYSEGVKIGEWHYWDSSGAKTIEFND